MPFLEIADYLRGTLPAEKEVEAERVSENLSCLVIGISGPLAPYVIAAIVTVFLNTCFLCFLVLPSLISAILFFPVPSEAPAITSTQHTSSTSIVVTWSSLALSLWRGVPLGYRIFYVLHDIYAISGTFQNVSSVSVTHQLLTAQLTQLEKYKKYVIWLCAFTIKGNGVKNSSFAEQMTDEDSKCCICNFKGN